MSRAGAGDPCHALCDSLAPDHLFFLQAASYWCGQTGVFLVRVGALLYVTGTLVVDGTTGGSCTALLTAEPVTAHHLPAGQPVSRAP